MFEQQNKCLVSLTKRTLSNKLVLQYNSQDFKKDVGNVFGYFFQNNDEANCPI